MRVLITGSNGFIGSNLTGYLSGLKKYKVYALVRPSSGMKLLKAYKDKITVIKTTGSFESINSALAKSRPDVIIHLAALTSTAHAPDSIKQLIDANILFGSLLLEAMPRNNTKCFINTGTFWEFSPGSLEYHPFNLYAATKRAFKKIMVYYANVYHLRCLTLNLYGTYGPFDPRPKIFSLFKKSLGVKQPVLFSPGRQKLDLVFIDDVVFAYEKAIRYVSGKQRKAFESFFIGSGRAVELRRIAGIYQDYAGRPLNIKWGGIPYRRNEIIHSQADIREAKRKLGWRPLFDLENGIKAMLDREK